jgi:NDP-sugar pyrophosphorylase family protein
MSFPVLITTSGTGSRLGVLTKEMNKCLVLVAGKPTIEYIIDRYPHDTEFVITLGYKGEQVRTALLHNYPDRHFTFVNVDPFEGVGSSLGYSLLQAESVLQRPFVFHACDTIVLEDIPAPTKDWAAGYVSSSKDTFDASPYRTHVIERGIVTRVNEKGEVPWNAIHIGITGVARYKDFWRILRNCYDSDTENSTWSDVHVLEGMITEGLTIESVTFSLWLDTGNIHSLQHTETYLSSIQQ